MPHVSVDAGDASARIDTKKTAADTATPDATNPRCGSCGRAESDGREFLRVEQFLERLDAATRQRLDPNHPSLVERLAGVIVFRLERSILSEPATKGPLDDPHRSAASWIDSSVKSARIAASRTASDFAPYPLGVAPSSRPPAGVCGPSFFGIMRCVSLWAGPR